MHSTAARWGFRPDIEGPRAVAELAVVRREVEATGTVRLARFYAARARRLLPAAGTVVVATAIGAATAWVTGRVLSPGGRLGGLVLIRGDAVGRSGVPALSRVIGGAVA